MNQTIEQEQRRAATAIDSAFASLEKLTAAQGTYQQECAKIDGMEFFTTEGKQQMRTEAGERFQQAKAAPVAAIRSHCETVEAAAETMAGVLDIGPETQNALEVLKLGKALDLPTKTAIFESFRGQPMQLHILGAVMEAQDMKPDAILKQLDFSGESVSKMLAAPMAKVESVVPSDGASLWEFGRTLDKVGKLIGAPVTKSTETTKGLSGGVGEAIRRAMGL